MTFANNWILWTLLAAGMQSVRTAGQKYLTGNITPLAATMVRYLFGLPFALAYLTVIASSRHAGLPPINATFLLCGFAAGALQIIATVLLVHLFTMRNFAVGSTYARTEIMMTAVLGVLLFGSDIRLWGWIAILACVIGVVMVTASRSGGVNRFWNRSAAYGLGAGLAFSLTSLLIREASRSFGIDDSMLTAAMTLCYMVSIQTLMTLGWIWLAEPEQFERVVRAWRPSLFVGITSVIGSAGWFTAMTLQFASYVKTLGQVEFLITFAISWFYFRERPTRPELVGMFLIMTGVVVLLIASR